MGTQFISPILMSRNKIHEDENRHSIKWTKCRATGSSTCGIVTRSCKCNWTWSQFHQHLIHHVTCATYTQHTLRRSTYAATYQQMTSRSPARANFQTCWQHLLPDEAVLHSLSYSSGRQFKIVKLHRIVSLVRSTINRKPEGRKAFMSVAIEVPRCSPSNFQQPPERKKRVTQQLLYGNIPQVLSLRKEQDQTLPTQSYRLP